MSFEARASKLPWGAGTHVWAADTRLSASTSPVASILQCLPRRASFSVFREGAQLEGRP